jgi:hypothetical protein
LLDWLNDTVANNVATPPTLKIYALHPQTFDPATLVTIQNGFLREFAVTTLDGASHDLGELSFVVVPGNIIIDNNPPTSFPINKPSGTFLASNFKLAIEGTQLNFTRSIAGLKMTWAKVAVPPSGASSHHQFSQGAMTASTITLSEGEQHASYFESWVNGTAAGTEQPRTGAIDIYNAALSSVQATIVINGMVPLQYLPFSTGSSATVLSRTLNLSMTQFTFQ